MLRARDRSPRPAFRRLSAADAEMLAHEQLGESLWVECPWLLVFSGPCPSIAELREQVGMRLAYQPELARRLAFPPLGLGRPFWVADPTFSVTRHVHLADDERFHGEDGWLRLVDDLMSRPLDRDRPLWQLWLAPGAHGDDHFAVILYHHHALADGHSGLRLLRTLLGYSPPSEPPLRSAVAGPATGPKMVLRGVVDLAAAGARFVRFVARLGREPRAEWERGRDSVAALGEILKAMLVEEPAPRIPAVNSELGPRRHALHVRLPFEGVREACDRFGCFPHDVYLAIVASALGRWLRSRGVDTEGLAVQAGVPVNVGSRDERRDLGNHISGLRLPLPVDDLPPDRLMEEIRRSTERIHGTRLIRGGQVLAMAESVLPPQLLAWASGLALGPRHINTVVSHMVPPRTLGQVAGRPLERVHSWTFLCAEHTVSFVAHTFGGELTVNVLVEPDLVPDHDVLAEAVRTAFEELRGAAPSDRPGPNGAAPDAVVGFGTRS